MRRDIEPAALGPHPIPASMAEPAVAEAEASAVAAGLRYVSDAAPGLRRLRRGRGFRYLDTGDQPLTDERALDRVRRLAVPPAWTDVWICPTPSGHIQATGYDARRRKQYIYHPTWREMRDETKYDRMAAFGSLLPKIRGQVDKDLRSNGNGAVPPQRILATLIRLLDQTALRIGSERYRRENESFGLTTLRLEHVEVEGSTLRFCFRGKGGKERSLALRDRRVANVVKRLQDLPGQELFCYRNGSGEMRDIDSADVNQYLRDISGEAITAKDFRTWTATVVAAEGLTAILEASGVPTKKGVNLATDEAAKRLGNTRTICRNSYIHPDVVEGYMDGWIATTWKAGYLKNKTNGLQLEEAGMLAVLRHAEKLRGRKRSAA